MKVFLSYASEQRELAQNLAQRLKSAGVDVFFDRESIIPSDSFDTSGKLLPGQMFLFS